jgi:hypothetical protein
MGPVKPGEGVYEVCGRLAKHNRSVRELTRPLPIVNWKALCIGLLLGQLFVLAISRL